MHLDEFSRRLLRWFDTYGRKQLPWQQEPTPYRVWVSEIMLQQTQVATVVPYYTTFMARFPDVVTLANAPLDQVLHLWSGLGYYARARHLHQTADIVKHEHGGQIPLDFATLSALPGIGRSTAGAILALAANQRYPILDGNVKRVLTRFHAIEGWPGKTPVLTTLWGLAERHTPLARVADYTQAIMDLGALVCTRSRPQCQICPLREDCIAHTQGRETAFPAPKPRRQLPIRRTCMVMPSTPQGEILLEKRPPNGIWGGLWSFPECPIEEQNVESWCRNYLGVEVLEVQPWSVLRHTFSHFHLDIVPLRITVKTPKLTVQEETRFVWYDIRHPDERGLAAPVKRLLTLLSSKF